MNQNLPNKGLWCCIGASCKAATPFEVGSVMVSEGADGDARVDGCRLDDRKKGQLMRTEASRMLWALWSVAAAARVF